MADGTKEARPIIKRKKVVAADGHHGGAWKVAYADFVTAMMAFFLLMWLLNATTESQRKGIADYFTPSIPISPISGGGDGVLEGDTMLAKDTLARDGLGGAVGVVPVDKGRETKSGGAPAEAEKPLAELESLLLGKSGESEVADDLLSHIVTRVTDEGLVIDIFAKEGRPLFASGSDLPTARMRAILAMIGDVIGLVSNAITISGHTDAAPFADAGPDAANDNWRLSSARADSARRALLAAEVEPARFLRITGEADRDLALPNAPLDPRNRRVTVTLLRSDR
ncbi:OmpA family protein [Pikeienuella piscinae]|uniref:OmpA family protein n=2 Tax=Pikeienuella piscinae TaxID=2748098 RepID=A0A7M3T716_9RHOB|nr:OmpA family protein [Pikeienuella piscinae]